MNVLLDTCIPKLVAEAVRSAGHDVTWTGEWEEDPGDDAILGTALDESRVLVTLDKDFGELAVVFGRPHCGILRVAGFRVAQQAAAVLQVLETHGAILSDGGIITAEPGRLRVRPPPDEEDPARAE